MENNHTGTMASWLKEKRQTLEAPLAWLALLGACLVNFVVVLPQNSFPIMYDELIVKFDSTRTDVGWVFSLHWTFVFASCIFISPLIDVYGCRKVAFTAGLLFGLANSVAAASPNTAIFSLTYGALSGIGEGALFLSCYSAIQNLFTANRGLANGILPLGYSVAGIIHPLYTSGYLLPTFGLTGTLLIHGGLCFQTVLFALAIKSTPKKGLDMSTNQNSQKDGKSRSKNTKIHPNEKSGTLPSVHCIRADVFNGNAFDAAVDTQRNKTDNINKTADNAPKFKSNAKYHMKNYVRGMLDFSPLKNRLFVLCVLSNILYWLSFMGLFTNIVSAAVHRDINPTNAAYLLSIVGFSNIVGKIFCSIIMNFSWMNVLVLPSVAQATISASAFVAAYSNTYALFATSAALIGMADAIHISSQPLVLGHVLGVEKFARGMSVLLLLTLPAPLGAAPLVGWLVDTLISYVTPFIILGVFALVSTTLGITMFVLSRCDHVKKKETNIPTIISECTISTKL